MTGNKKITQAITKIFDNIITEGNFLYKKKPYVILSKKEYESMRNKSIAYERITEFCSKSVSK